MEKRVFIIILNWNGYDDTVECVESCRKLDYHRFSIVIVDNGSQDGSEDRLRTAFSDLVILQAGDNIGYAGGNNVGIRYALHEGADYVWLLNNDTTVDPMALAEMVRTAELDPVNGMVGSKILSYFDPRLIYYAGGWIDIDSGATGHIGMGETDCHWYDHQGNTGYITGCSLLVSRFVIDQIGLMDEDYFLYFEESEWCVRARKNGFVLKYVPSSIIYHKESVSTKKVSGALTYYMTRNSLYFISRNGNNAKWWSRFSTDAYNFLRIVRHRDFVQAFSMLAAYWHWINGYRGRRDRLVRS